MSSVERDAGWHHQAIFEHPSELIVVLDAVRDDAGRVANWRYRDLNSNALAMIGRSREAVVGHLLTEVLPERAARLTELCSRVLEERKPYRYEASVGDTQYWVCLFPISNNTIVSSGTDITERSQAERETQRLRHVERAEKEWLAAVLDSMTEEVYFTDTEMRYTYANPAALREFGHQSVGGVAVEQVVSRLEVLRPDGSPRPLNEAPPLRALRGEIVRNEEQIVRTPRTGELRHRHVSSAPVRDALGEIIGSVSVVRDVTEQKRVEAALRTRDARVSALLRLADEFRSLILPSEVAFAASRLLGETLGASRCGYGTIDPRTGTLTIEREWRADELGSSPASFNLHERCPHVDSVALESGFDAHLTKPAAPEVLESLLASLKAPSRPAIEGFL